MKTLALAPVLAAHLPVGADVDGGEPIAYGAAAGPLVLDVVSVCDHARNRIVTVNNNLEVSFLSDRLSSARVSLSFGDPRVHREYGPHGTVLAEGLPARITPDTPRTRHCDCTSPRPGSTIH